MQVRPCKHTLTPGQAHQRNSGCVHSAVHSSSMRQEDKLVAVWAEGGVLGTGQPRRKAHTLWLAGDAGCVLAAAEGDGHLVQGARPAVQEEITVNDSTTCCEGCRGRQDCTAGSR